MNRVIELGRTHGAAGTPVRLSNAYCVALANQDPEYRAVLAGPGWNFPDGAPVAYFMRRQNRKSPSERVRGPSLFAAVLDRGRSAGLRHFMLGATQDTLDRLVESIGNRYPGAEVAGTYSPPFGPLDESFYTESIARIEESGADVVWVGLGTPKQDFAAAELARRVPLPFLGVGAAFDFVAGVVPEAPLWVQRSGFEWLYRLVSEPRRLWRRYLIGNTQFLWSVATAPRHTS
ncbi:WecB/TagA/CpsF family glycosyltransferase [Tsukamurella sp. 8F]|uniref:WecB/TagA/CpsF family glycosyltransferase n=1 Tax=unclassified Tsukamurella TaxID=2633480 RepID=UPI0023B9EBF1|nr:MULTISPECIES: WecB/TagA/CpsF family glycosyltransferase [unclassified Tsukamurella]MDF0530640.1 WecB/TagA/CpsF family glycosyltransferase [Tsukamurella sp. 8J]MDF0587841.1 WecB/TagA/CpsF family glycosyltransferase [Tsukamurella sp. 8F]